MNSFLDEPPHWQHIGMALVRMALGILLKYHGQEVLNEKLIQEYILWDMFYGPNGQLLLYMERLLELISGILIFVGLFTRIATLLNILTF
jgi:putative oxidoreductase